MRTLRRVILENDKITVNKDGSVTKGGVTYGNAERVINPDGTFRTDSAKNRKPRRGANTQNSSDPRARTPGRVPNTPKPQNSNTAYPLTAGRVHIHEYGRKQLGKQAKKAMRNQKPKGRTVSEPTQDELRNRISKTARQREETIKARNEGPGNPKRVRRANREAERLAGKEERLRDKKFNSYYSNLHSNNNDSGQNP